MNREAARLAREAADAAEAADPPGTPRWVAGALGPTNRTASLSPDVNDPGARNVSFEQLADAYLEAARGLVAGGADLLLIETIYDTLNAKAAIFAVEALWDELGFRLPLVISGTITDLSGRTLSGQTVARSGTACAMRDRSRWGSTARWAATCCGRTRRSSRASPTRSSRSTRTLACRTRSAATTRRRPTPRKVLRELAADGQLNIVGGCCGTTPEHIAVPRRGGAGPAAARRPGRSSGGPAWRASSRSRSGPTRCSSTSASARTSPARAASRGSSPRTATPRRSRSRASRSSRAPRCST